MPKKKLFRVGRAYTGLGLFAAAPIKKRTRIVEYQGRLLTTKQADPLERAGNRYLYEINSRWTIDGTSRRNVARYANHSCNPNAETVTVEGHKVFVRALRNIKPGEEITYHYGRDYLKNVIGSGRCRCGRCRRQKARRLRKLRAARLRPATAARPRTRRQAPPGLLKPSPSGRYRATRRGQTC